LAAVDEFVNEEIPGGWVTVGLAAATAGAASAAGGGAGAAGAGVGSGAGGTAGGISVGGAFVPTAGSAASFTLPGAAAAGTAAGAIATEAGQAAFFNALATGATSAEAVSAGLAADAALGVGALSAEQLLNVGGFTPTPGSGASFVIDPSTALGAGSYVTPDLMGPTYGELGVTGVEGGLAGPTYGELGYTGLNNAEAIAAADAAAQGISAKDVLSNANRLKNIAKMLTGSETSKIYGRNVPTANQFSAYQQMAQPIQEQFGGYYQMNQNPFTFANPLAAALKGKDSTGYDVSGTGGTSLKTANLAKLLA
jgi:hypothetical protein